MYHDPDFVGTINGASFGELSRGLSYSERASLGAAYTLHSLAAGEEFCFKGSHWSLLRVHSGALADELQRPHSASALMGIVLPGELRLAGLGEIGTQNFRALSETKLLLWHASALEELQAESPRLRANILGSVQRTLTTAWQRQVLLTQMSARERIAALILDLWQRQGRTAEICLYLSREEAGALTGLTLETVSRQMKALEREGVIALPSRGQISILDTDALQKQAGADLKQAA